MSAVAAGPRPAWRAPAALSALTLSTFLYVTAETLPVGLLDPIARDLGVTDSRVGLLVTVYGLVVVVASIPLTRARSPSSPTFRPTWRPWRCRPGC